MDNILSKIKGQLDLVEREETFVTSGLKFNLPRTLNKIDLYYNSEFLRGKTDTEGFKKLFSNITKFRCNAATKAIDIDTKDIRLIAEDGESYYRAWFYERELKQFMKDEGFAFLFNRIAEVGPRYGSAVVKDCQGSPELVNLRNLAWDPTQSDIKKSSFVIEKHIYSPDEFQEEALERGWDADKVKTVLEIYKNKNSTEIQVIEWYGYGDKDDFTMDSEVTDDKEESETFVRGRNIIAGLEFYSTDPKQSDRSITPITLDAAEVDKWPYKIWHWENEEGRCLGVGIVEDMFINQEYHNDISHLERKSLHWSSKKLFQTRDDTAPSNLFSDVANGQVLTIKSEITPVSMEERNLPQYNLVFDRIGGLANQQTFTFEVNTGEAMPSGTPFRMGALLSQAVNSHYAYKRENFAMFIKEIITDFVLPSFKKKKKKAHTFQFDGSADQLEKVAGFLIDAHMWEAIEKYYKKTGSYPNPEVYAKERARVEAAVMAKDGLHCELPDSFYDDCLTRIEIDITGESVSSADVESLTTIFQIIAANPAVMQMPIVKNLLDMIMNRSGQNPVKLFGAGSAPAPAAPTGMPPAMPNTAPMMEASAGGANPSPSTTV